MRHVPGLLLALLLAGCSFVTSSPQPFFADGDFVVPVGAGVYAADDGVRMDVRVAGRLLGVTVTDPKGKAVEYVVGAVPTGFPGYFLLQAVTAADGGAGRGRDKVAYLPARIGDGEVMLLSAPRDDDPACDAVFARYGFKRSSWTWSREAPFTRPELLAFYEDLIDVVAGDPRWSVRGGPRPYAGIVLHRDPPP